MRYESVDSCCGSEYGEAEEYARSACCARKSWMTTNSTKKLGRSHIS
jgi:hypothetical protein